MTLTLVETGDVPPSDTASSTAVKRAVIYLRVSSDGQVKTDYDPEGLSLPAQREACKRYAERHGAVVVREYVEPGVSGGSLLKRASFRRMIEETAEQRDVDYVIVWSVSRWARNQEDHWVARGLIKKAGAKLLSVKEPIGEDTSHGIMLEGVMAAVAAARRIEISDDVKRTIKRKIEVGGTHGLAPIGYLNVREPLPQGGEVRTVAIDHERAPIIVWAFETYATGLYSLSDMVVLLEARGLYTRATRRRAPRPLGLSRVHKLLGNPYYAGFVTHQGHVYEGRHEALVSQELFDKVQAVLVAHRHSGERDRRHLHYLKGTIRCGTCGSQLVYSRNKGNGGVYEYFVCPRNQRGECPQSYQPVDLVEAAIEDYYATVPFSQEEREQVRQAITKDLGQRVATAKGEIARCQAVLEEVREQERKLLHMHYEERISGELFDAEQDRIRERRQDAEALIARLSISYDDITATLDVALEILAEDLHDIYKRGDDTIRRLINQAIFNALFVCDETITDAELAEPFAALRALHDAIRRLPSGAVPQAERRQRRRQRCPEDAKGPRPARDQEPFRVGSISNHLVRPSGLEPPRTKRSTRPSTLRVYQFRHRRRGAEYSPGPSPTDAPQTPACRHVGRIRTPHRLHPSTGIAKVRTHVRRSPQSTQAQGAEQAIMDLTKRQQEIFDFIRKHSAKYGYPPTVRDIGKAVGLASSSTVHAHLANLEKIGLLRRDPSKPRAIELLDRAMGSAVDSVRGIVRPESLPLLGSVAAGAPMLAEENVEEYVSVPELAGGGDGQYLLQIRGDSMKDAGIIDGDYVVVRSQDTARDGDIVVALLGEEATVKRFFREPDHIRLQPENETMEPIRSTDVKVLGRVVGLLRSV
jgi:site-specific DNA recombinase